MSIERNLLHQELNALGILTQSEVGLTPLPDFLIPEDRLNAIRAAYGPVMDAANKTAGNTYLTDIVFYGFHPELNRRKLMASDTTLIKEWQFFKSQAVRKNTVDYLTDVVFYSLHPDLGGRKLTQSSTYTADLGLIQEWKDIKNQVVLHYFGKEMPSGTIDFSQLGADNQKTLADYISKLRGYYFNIMDLSSGFLNFQTKGTSVIVRGKPLFSKYVSFENQNVVMTIREEAAHLVYEKIIPFLIETLNVRAAKKLIQVLLEFEKGTIVDTFIDLMYYRYLSLSSDTEEKQAYRKNVLRILEMTAQIYLDSRKPADIQSGVETKGSKNENIRAKSMPDNPKYNLTGKFEYINNVDSNQPTMGIVMCINQAGRWLEGVISVVYNNSSVSNDAAKSYYRFYTEVLDWDKATNLIFISGNDKILGFKPQLLISNSNTLALKIENKSATIPFRRVANQPILTERHLVYFKDNSLIKKLQWTPILTPQAINIKSYFKNFISYKPILPHHYYANTGLTGIANRSRNIEDLLKKIAKGEQKLTLLNDSLEQFVEENFHVSDKDIASFLIRYYLNQRFFDKGDGWTLSLTSWLYRSFKMYEKKSKRDSSAKDFIFGNTSGDKITPLSNQLYEYKIDVKLTGFGIGLFIKGGYYRGDMTISCDRWKTLGVKDDATLRISLFEFGGGFVESINFGQSFSGIAKSDILWMPSDFKGDYKIAKADAEIGANIGKVSKDIGVSAGISGTLGFMELNGNANLPPLVFPIYSLGGVIAGVEPEPERTKMDKEGGIGVEASISMATGNIWGSSKLPAPTEVIRYGDEKAVLEKTYKGDDRMHFKHDSALLTNSAGNLLRKMCANELFVLMTRGTVVKIVGHTDRSGKEKYNLELSANRANNVKQKIMDICGANIKASIEIEGKGESLARKEGVKDGIIFPKYRRVDVEINGIIVLSLVEG